MLQTLDRDVEAMPNERSATVPAIAMISVGVTGHRPHRLAGVDPAALGERIRAALMAFAEAVGPGHGLRLVSNLAEGADTIAFDQAAALGWTLDVVLPFDPARYGEDFATPGSLAGLRERLDEARAVFALDGAGDDEDLAAAAYERAGRVMLAQSDVLLAIWDGQPARGRGGSAQIVAEAVIRGVPVIHVDVQEGSAPELLWDRLDEHDLGQQTLDTVPRGGLDRLPRLLRHLHGDQAAVALRLADERPRPSLAIAYPALLMIAGVRRMRWSDWWRPRAARAPGIPLGDGWARGFGPAAADLLTTRFRRADASATEAGRRFRSAYVSNFALAALAVAISLTGLVLPDAAKSVKLVLLALELLVIASILVITRLGNRSGWHRRWLDCRRVAEQLRCLAISAQLGDLRLRGNLHPAAQEVARRLGVPAVVTDAAYLASVQTDLLRLLDGQIAYLCTDAGWMQRLEHRLHRAGAWLFGTTAAICILFLLVEVAAIREPGLNHLVEAAQNWGTVCSAALPAVGAAIYGIRMQGDFAGTAERNEVLAAQLGRMRAISGDPMTSYDLLLRRVTQVADLLTQDLSSWFQSSSARPLALPG